MIMEYNLKEIFSQITPGTIFREGLDNILDAGTGALVVLEVKDTLGDLIDGGFELNCSFTPQRLHELSKMDGAIILDENATKIKYANVHLQPDKSFQTNESGTRHRSAQRVAKQTNNLVIAISERRNRITLYKGDFRYKVKNLGDLMIEASQAMKTFERYFVKEKETHKEIKNPYYTLREDEEIVLKLMDHFGVLEENGHIINGHTPVLAKNGELPIRAGKKLLVIDGGLSKAYQRTTGTAGYTLIYNSYGLRLASHKPFKSIEEAIEDSHEIISVIQLVDKAERKKVKDTETGELLIKNLKDLRILLKMYRSGHFTSKN
ncbi:MAG TPA: DNA integrity scanning protein DisA [Fusobacteriaceae bacterium]|nr:DNA integrity scanning protein DisA [Fusobacteriaceae bacterium]